MGANLSSTEVVDTSKDIISPTDRNAEAILAVAWAGTFYSFGIIWCVMRLIDRWRGPHGDRSINFVSVLAAIVMSTAWPVVAVVLLLSGN
jgi:hypothetical protein